MPQEKSATSRIVILIGLVLALVVPLFGLSRSAEHLPGIPPLLGREGFWWALIALVLLYALIVERKPLSSIGLRRPTWKTFAFGIGTAVFTLLAVGLTIQFIFSALHLTQNQEALKQIAGLPLWYKVLLVTRAAVGEELLFRGYGIERIEELTGSKLLAGLVTLVLFTFGHLSYWGAAQLIVAGLAGLVLTILYLWRRDLGANIVAHWVIDGVGIFFAH